MNSLDLGLMLGGGWQMKLDEEGTFLTHWLAPCVILCRHPSYEPTTGQLWLQCQAEASLPATSMKGVECVPVSFCFHVKGSSPMRRGGGVIGSWGLLSEDNPPGDSNGE